MMKYVIFLISFLAITTCLVAVESSENGEPKEFVVENGDASLMKWLVENEYLADYHQMPPTLHFVGDSTSERYLDDHGYSYHETGNLTERLLPGYQPYQVIADSIRTLAALYPGITKLDTLGPTTCHIKYLAGNDNYAAFPFDVLCLKLSDNPEIEEDEPNFFYAGGIHARETISVEVTMHILTWLLENYGIDEDATGWIDGNQIWVVPVINPDGYEVSVQQWHAYHRKNMRDNDQDGNPDFSSIDGVDLNRNFGYIWGNNGASNSTSSSIYHGPCAWSEIETIYMREMIRARKFWGGITYHSSGEWVIYPLGHIDGACSLDHEIMGNLAYNMAITIPQIDGTGHYAPVQASDFTYTCQGTMGDWAYSEERVFGFTIELNNSAGSYYPPPPYIDQIKADNLQAALIMLDRINFSTLHGHVTNEVGTPLEAEMWITGIDDATGMTPVEPYRCDSVTGRFERPLLPGTYEITFRMDGYFDSIFEGVSILSNEITTLNPVLYSQNVLSCEISIDSNLVNIDWVDPGGFNYTVLSCPTPDGDFEPDETGAYIREDRWSAPLTEPMRFYQIQRIER